MNTGTSDALRAGRGRSRGRRVRQLLGAVLVVLLAGVTGLGAFVYGLLHARIDLQEPAAPRSAVLLDAGGQPFAAVRPPEMREDVPADQIPQVMRDAMVAAEDARFFDHEGVDPSAVVRAAYADIVAGRAEQGGSTITQQYIKNVFVGNDRTLLRKVKEAALAVRLERQLPKQEILTRYLNMLYLGNGTVGVQAAAKFYFGIPASALTLPQAAMLAGIAPAPSLWNPVRNFDIAKQRQLYVLNQMVAAGMLSSQQATDAYRTQKPQSSGDIVGQAASTASPTIAPEFADMVKQQLLDRLPGTLEDREDVLFRSGLAVQTTLDTTLQQALIDAVATVLPKPDDPSAAVVAIDPRTGDVKALTTRYVTANSSGYQRGGFNLATQATRSSGSTIKPFTLATALENGRNLDERVYAPRCGTVPNPGAKEPYTFCNAGDSEAGRFTLATGLQYSVNTVYVPLAAQVGVDKVMKLAGDAGLAPRDNLKNLPSSALGVEVTPLSMAQAYATLVNHGVRQDVRLITALRSGVSDTSPGQLRMQQPARPEGTRVIDEKAADAVVGVLEKVVAAGTATSARQPFPVYGKTGTTNDYTNAWFVGCTPELCIATWMGYDQQYVDGQPNSLRNVEGVPQVFGGTLPAKIFSTALDRYRALLATYTSATPPLIPQLAPAGPPAAVAPAPESVTQQAAPAPRPAASPSRRLPPRPSSAPARGTPQRSPSSAPSSASSASSAPAAPAPPPTPPSQSSPPEQPSGLALLPSPQG